jgi:hypothetical protein
MGKLIWSLLALYLTAAAAYGGWSGRDLWAGWGVWCFLLPPAAWAAVTSFRWWRSGGPLRVAVVMSAVGVAGMGASALGLAWVIAELTGRWSAGPAGRAIAGAGFGAAAVALVWATRNRRHAAAPDRGGR